MFKSVALPSITSRNLFADVMDCCFAATFFWGINHAPHSEAIRTLQSQYRSLPQNRTFFIPSDTLSQFRLQETWKSDPFSGTDIQLNDFASGYLSCDFMILACYTQTHDTGRKSAHCIGLKKQPPTEVEYFDIAIQDCQNGDKICISSSEILPCVKDNLIAPLQETNTITMIAAISFSQV